MAQCSNSGKKHKSIPRYVAFHLENQETVHGNHCFISCDLIYQRLTRPFDNSKRQGNGLVNQAENQQTGEETAVRKPGNKHPISTV